MRRDRERGLALLLTAVVGLFAFAFWGLAYRATREAIAAEAFTIGRSARDATVTRALARAMLLLESGDPPRSPASYLWQPPAGPAVALTFTRTEASRWTLEARPATAAEIRSLPPAPPSF